MIWFVRMPKIQRILTDIFYDTEKEKKKNLKTPNTDEIVNLEKVKKRKRKNGEEKQLKKGKK